MAEGTVGILNVELRADLTNLQSGFASAKMQAQDFSGQAGANFANVGNEAQKAGAEVAGLGTESQKSGEKISGAGKQGADGIGLVADALIAIGAVTAFKKIYDGFKQCIDASVEFESAMAGVAKTTDLTDVELSAMGDSIKKMATEIPATTTEIAGVAEAAGQLGIAKDGLLDFTETMTMLGTATNMTADEGATMLAQFANITQMPTDEYSNLGSTIVALGNSTATTESKITEMAQGMAASATNAGISEDAILAMAAATASVGIEADAGSTSWSKFMQEMQSAVETGKGLDQWAAVANMTAADFAKLWGQDAAQALNVWIQGLGNAAAQGQSMTATLEALNITEVRETRMLQSLANSGDLLTNALATGNQAWKQNTALQKEAATRYATTESKAKMLENRQKNLASTVGDQLNPLYSNLLDIGTDVTGFFQDMFEQNELLSPALVATGTALGVITVGTLAYSAAQKIKAKADGEATITQMILNAVMNANPAFLVVTGIVALTAALSVFALSLAEADAETQALNAETESLITSMEDNVTASQGVQTQFDGQAKTTDNLISRLFELKEATSLTQAEEIEMGNAVAQLNTQYPELGLKMETAKDANGKLIATFRNGKGEIIENAKAMKMITDELRTMQEAAAKKDSVTQMYQDMSDATTQLATTQAKSSGTLNKYNEETQELMKNLANMPDFFANLTMWQSGWSKEMRDDVESVDELGKSEKDLKKQISETEAAIKSITGTEETLTPVTDKASGAIKYFKGANGDLYNALGETLPSLESLKERFQENREAFSEAGISLDEYTEATLGMTDAEVKAYEQSVLMGDQYDTLLEKYGALGITRAEYIEQTEGMNEAQLAEYNNTLLQNAAMATMEERYKTLFTATYESMSGQFDLWDTLNDKVDITKKTLIAAQKQQIKYFSELANNIDSLSGRGIEGMDKLLSSIDTTTVEGAAAVAAFNSMTDSELRAYIANMSKLDSETSRAADASSRAITGYSDATEKGLDKASTATDKAKGKTEQSLNDAQRKYEETSGTVKTETESVVEDTKKMAEGVKTAIDNLNSTMPEIVFKVNKNIPLPHFSVSGNLNVQTGSVPTVGVDWFDKGGVFTTPQVIGIAEKRPEFVGAAEDLESYITKAVNNAVFTANPELFKSVSLPQLGNTYGGGVNISMPITVNGKMTDAEINHMADKMIYTVRKRIGGLMN